VIDLGRNGCLEMTTKDCDNRGGGRMECTEIVPDASTAAKPTEHVNVLLTIVFPFFRGTCRLVRMPLVEA
jgi:hypothetical protein